MSETMTLTNQIDGWTLRDSAISHVPLNFGPDLASPVLNQLIRAMWDCKSPPSGGYLQSHMAESFCRFFELKSFLFKLYCSELSLLESSIGSMMINTISPGSRGSLASSIGSMMISTISLGSRGSLAAPRPATAALRPAALGLPWWAEIYPYCPGSQERLYLSTWLATLKQLLCSGCDH